LPVVKIGHIGEEAIWGLWEITETLPELLQILAKQEVNYPIPQGKSHTKLSESVAARVLAQQLATMVGLKGGTIKKDACDCPFWEHETARLSLSHTTGFAAAIIHHSASCGIDIEWPHERIRKIAPRVFSSEEIRQAADLQQLTAIWCAKEALYKWHRVGSLEFRTQLQITLDGNQINGRVQDDNGVVSPLLRRENFGELVVVYCWL
jgi:4'-phosphopantetheinyl transferase EntD